MNVADEIVVQKVKQGILSIDKDAEIILFGSRARGDARTGSDWDFLFLTDEEVNESLEDEVINRVLDVEIDEEATVQVIAKNKGEWRTRYQGTPFYASIEEEGVKI